MGPSECYGLKGFLSKWLLRVVGLPAIFSLLVLVYYMYDRRTNQDVLQPKINAISHAFFAVFFCYPTICIVRHLPVAGGKTILTPFILV